jgi:hypothetical protein
LVGLAGAAILQSVPVGDVAAQAEGRNAARQRDFQARHFPKVIQMLPYIVRQVVEDRTTGTYFTGLAERAGCMRELLTDVCPTRATEEHAADRAPGAALVEPRMGRRAVDAGR